MEFFLYAHAIFFLCFSGWVVYAENKASIKRKIEFGFFLAVYYVGWQLGSDGFNLTDFYVLMLLILSSIVGAAVGWLLRKHHAKRSVDH